ncbi:MAG: hypothetical protein M1819_001416 [Sarea resinae]|nr:MAG: hypothetical protein M1819_001416 [Sarea resinae]
MATQNASSIPFSYSHEQQHFRLLELPPALLEPLNASSPPTLSIKSSSSSTSRSDPASTQAVLCTPSQTYQLRQVQSSNTIFLIQPSAAHQREASGDEVPILSGASRLSAIASSKSTLELHHSTASAIPHLKQLLLPYDATLDDDRDPYMNTQQPMGAASIRRTRKSTFSDMPFCDNECERSWRSLVAFEHDGACFLPSASSSMDVWKALHTSAVAEGIDLTKQFKVYDLWALVQEDGFPQGLVEAVIRRVSSEEDQGVDWACLDQETCIRWLGIMVLAQFQEKTHLDLATKEFLRLWRDALPAKWKVDDSIEGPMPLSRLDSLKGFYTHPTTTSIRIVPRWDELTSAGTASATATTTSTTSSSTSKGSLSNRKWHEKFKAGRR